MWNVDVSVRGARYSILSGAVSARWLTTALQQPCCRFCTKQRRNPEVVTICLSGHTGSSSRLPVCCSCVTLSRRLHPEEDPASLPAAPTSACHPSPGQTSPAQGLTTARHVSSWQNWGGRSWGVQRPGWSTACRLATGPPSPSLSTHRKDGASVCTADTAGQAPFACGHQIHPEPDVECAQGTDPSLPEPAGSCSHLPSPPYPPVPHWLPAAYR